MAIKKSRTHSRAKREYGISHDFEICGKNDSSSIALIEGAQMAVCSTCSKFGKILRSVDLQGHTTVQPRATAEEDVEEIIEHYGKMIRQKRESLKLPITVIAERIQERESYLEKIETEHLLPSLNVARKLEKELGVKLIQKSKTEHVSTPQGKFAPPTLADFAVTKKK